MNDCIKGLFERKSVRMFTEEEVPNQIKDILLESAAQAPTAGCQMLYSIIDITDQGRKETLAKLCDNQPFIAKAPLVFVFVADVKKWYQSYEIAEAGPRKLGVGDLMLAVSDTNIAAQNMVVAAESLGLGSCYIGDVMENCEDMRSYLKIPSHCIPVTMLVIGYPTETQKQRKKPTRFSKEYYVFENEYEVLSEEKLKQGYETRERAGRAEGAEIRSFEEYMNAFCKRKFNSDFSVEMTRSMEQYLKDYE